MVAVAPTREHIGTTPAPSEAGELITLVRLEIGGMRYVTPLDSVAAVVEPVSLVQSPDSEGGVWIGHIHGPRASIPVASGFELLGSRSREREARRIVIFRGEQPIGLAVGAVLSSRVVGADEILPFGDFAAVLHNLLVSGIVWNEGEAELVLDISAILSRLDRDLAGARSTTEVLRGREQRLTERYSRADRALKATGGLEVRFRGSGERWMLPIATIRHVADRLTCHPLPDAPRQVEGIVTWRRRPIPVIDPTIGLGIEQPVSVSGRLIVIGEPVAVGEATDSADAALLVDEIIGLHDNLRFESDRVWDALDEPMRPINLLDVLSP